MTFGQFGVKEPRHLETVWPKRVSSTSTVVRPELSTSPQHERGNTHYKY